MKNIKTTLPGIFCIVGGCVMGIFGMVKFIKGDQDGGIAAMTTAGGIITAGYGLIKAQDAGK